MKVLVTGATGFTGSYTVPVLLQQGMAVRCFVRKTSDISHLSYNRVKVAYGDLNEPGTLKQALVGMDALVNIASIGFGHAPAIVTAAVETGIRRAVFISTTAIFTRLNADSKRIRLAAEEMIAKSGLAYTILRPTMIYGSPRDRNISRLIRYVERYPLIPVFGDGRHLQQPIHVEDLAWAIAGALQSNKTLSKAYNIAGSSPLTFNELIDTTSRQLGKRIRRLHLPAGVIIRCLQFVERRGFRLPVSSEQVQRLNEDKNFDYSEATADFGFKSRTFSEGVRKAIATIRNNG